MAQVITDIAEMFDGTREVLDEFHDALLPVFGVALVGALGMAAYKKQEISAIIPAMIAVLLMFIYGDIAGLIRDIAQGFSEKINPDGPELLKKFYILAVNGVAPEGEGNIRDIVGGSIIFKIQMLIVQMTTGILLAVQNFILMIMIVINEAYLMFLPLTFSALLFEKTRSIAIKSFFGHFSVLIWPVGWAVLAVLMNILGEAIPGSIRLSAAVIMSITVLSIIWTIGYIVMPFVISKVLLSGGNAASATFGALVTQPAATAAQTALTIGGVAGVAGAISASGGSGAGKIGGASGTEGVSPAQFMAQMDKTEAINADIRSSGSSSNVSSGGGGTSSPGGGGSYSNGVSQTSSSSQVGSSTSSGGGGNVGGGAGAAEGGTAGSSKMGGNQIEASTAKDQLESAPTKKSAKLSKTKNI